MLLGYIFLYNSRVILYPPRHFSLYPHNVKFIFRIFALLASVIKGCFYRITGSRPARIRHNRKASRHRVASLSFRYPGVVISRIFLLLVFQSRFQVILILFAVSYHTTEFFSFFSRTICIPSLFLYIPVWILDPVFV